MPGVSPLDQIWHSLPEERENLRPYVDRAKAYANECGCGMGGAFAVTSIGLLMTYGVLFNGIGTGSLLADVACGLVVVFVACGVGKAMGIGIARVRLLLLYRSLRARFPVRGNSPCPPVPSGSIP